jgi:hypothetical protein
MRSRHRARRPPSSLSRSEPSIDSMGPRQNRTRDDTEQLKSTPAACDRIPTSVASNKQFTHSLVIRHKLQLCRTNSVRTGEKENVPQLRYYSPVHSFILFSLLLDSIALLSFTVSRVCFCSYFLVTPGCFQNAVSLRQIVELLVASLSHLH